MKNIQTFRNRLPQSRAAATLTLMSAVSIILFVAGCGASAATKTPSPTASPFPTYNYVSPTSPAAFSSGVEASETVAVSATPDADRIALGKSRYVALQCGSCHGDAGQGTGKAKPLAGTTLSEDDFINVLRSGGGMGNDHLFSTNRLSQTGGENLYLYVKSLPASK